MREDFWFIEPLEPIIARDGRQFGRGGGASARSLDFPFPSTATGVARARTMLSMAGGDTGEFSGGRGHVLAKRALSAVRVKGPLFARMSISGEIEILPPAPADAVIVAGTGSDGSNASNTTEIIPLRPIAIPDGYFTNAPEAGICGMVKHTAAKPHKRSPRFWNWSDYLAWLAGSDSREVNVKRLGTNGPALDRRTHVEIDRKAKAGVDRMLFETLGLDFGSRDGNRYGMLIHTLQRDDEAIVDEGLAPFGSERRLTAWLRAPENSFPPCPPEIRESILENKACRMILLTPALFERGWRPKWLTENAKGSKPILVAAAVKGYRVVSGFSLQLGKPRPTRRLCPAGSVFFLRFEDDHERINRWIDKYWFGCVSDEKHDRHDGFGLAALGTWDGKEISIGEAISK